MDRAQEQERAREDEKPSPFRFLLAHHWPEEYERCYRVAGLWVCARCLGLYPSLAFMLAFQVSGWVTEVPLEPLFLYALPLPALISWTRHRVWHAQGSKPVSTITGAVLGVGLGRGLYLHLRDPWCTPFVLQCCLLAAWVLAVEAPFLLRRLRQR